jgi:large subunit ribosomal protein L3
MIRGIWGKKIGMTQVFSDDQKVVPVTAIDVSNWYVTQVKTKERDGYDAIQLGCVKKKHNDQTFSSEWLRSAKKYFAVLREVRLADASQSFEVGQQADVAALLSPGDFVDVFGVTVGKGFQGVVKRHGFAGGSASHGSTMGRRPGSIGNAAACGKVDKGKKMPGHMGNRQRAMQNLRVIKVEPQAHVVFVKGSIPGKSGSLVFVRKCGVNNVAE